MNFSDLKQISLRYKAYHRIRYKPYYLLAVLDAAQPRVTARDYLSGNLLNAIRVFDFNILTQIPRYIKFPLEDRNY